MPKTSESPDDDQGFIPFTDLNAVPAEIAIHQGARLTLEQVNEIIPRAYKLGTSDLPNMGAAWAEFRETHRIENTIWVTGNGDSA